MDAADNIKKKALGELDSFAYSRGRSRAHDSVKQLTEQTAHEYGNRFLIELVQNAYDAHAKNRTDGQVAIRYDPDEGDFGTLYIANRGNPFSHDNFLAVCDIGLSSKEPGEAIGNKGLGFRSVLQISRAPEIFSAAVGQGRSETFGGYCFGFAKPDDIRALCAEHFPDKPELADDALQHLSPYSMPIHLQDQVDAVRAFARDGFATVVRLPLSGEPAVQAVNQELGRIRTNDAPLLLFLDRVSCLTVESAGSANAWELTRALAYGPTLGDGYQSAVVRVGDQGDFLVFTADVDGVRLAAALQESVDADKLPSSWLRWRDDAKVSVAVRLDEEIERPRLYNFLPMGPDADCPFHGYLNAPFYTTTDRTDIHEDVPLNVFLLDEAAVLCARAILALRASSSAHRGRAIADLLTWSRDIARLTASFVRLNANIESLDVLPVAPTADARSWGSLAETNRWSDEGLSVITRERLSRETDAVLLSPELGSARAARIDELCLTIFGVGLDPPLSDVAAWTETIAKNLARRKRMRLREWDKFYADVAKLFELSAEAVMPKAILLGEDNRLYAAETNQEKRKRRRIVFFQPRSVHTAGEEEIDPSIDVRVPALLRKEVVLMHPELTWYEGRPLRRTAAREFLESKHLVRRYNTGDLRDHVAALLTRSRSERLHTDALRFLYQLHRAAKADLRLDELQIRVPTVGGTRLASEAYFSSAWRTQKSDELRRFIIDARGASADVAELDQHLLLAPQAWPFQVDDVASLTAFLGRVGVRDGLWPVAAIAPDAQVAGTWLQGENRRSLAGLDPRDADCWLKEVQATGYTPGHPYTPYRFQSGLYRIAGQGDLEALSSSARLSFARLVLRGLSEWPDEALTCVIFRPQHPNRPDSLRWPTPLGAFLKSSRWLPIRSDGQEVEFARPQDAWVAFPNDDEPAPRYGPTLPIEFSRILEQHQTAFDRVRVLGLKAWGRPEFDGELVRQLGRLLFERRVPESQTDAFRKTYVNAWTRLLDDPLRVSAILSPEDRLVVSRNHSLDTVPVAMGDLDGSQPPAVILVDDRQDELRTQLTRALGFATFEIDAEHGAAAIADLRSSLGERVRSMEDLQVQVLVDGSAFSPSDADRPLIAGDGDPLGLLVSLALEFRSSLSSLRSQATRNEMLRRLRRIRIRRADEIGVAVEGRSISLPSFLRNAIAVDDAEVPTIVVKDADPKREDSGIWSDLPRLARPMAQLLGRPELSDALELAAIRLEGALIDRDLSSPVDDDYANAFGVSSDAVRDIRRTIRGATSAALEFLRPVVAYFAGRDVGDGLPGGDDDLATDEAVIEALTSIESSLPMSPQELLGLCHASDTLEQLRDQLELDYERFNTTLEELGLRPFENRDGQRQEFEYFKEVHREEAFGVLRHRWLEDFSSSRPLADYVAARQGFGELLPAPRWLRSCHLPTAGMMAERLNVWLSDLGTRPFQAWDKSLRPVDELRQKNAAILRSLSTTLCELIEVWSLKHGVATDALWSDEPNAASDLSRRLHETGRGDFLPLDEAGMLSEIKMLGVWPNAMALSVSLDDLGITQNELTAFRQRGAEEQRRRQVALNSIEINGLSYEASPDHFASIAEAVRSSLTAEFLGTSRNLASLDEIAAPAQSRGTAGAAVEARRMPRLSEPQRDAVGLVGEVAAFEWLKRQFPESMNDTCWKSAYRQHVVGGEPGDDGLGYDFELERRTYKMYWEVKASMNNAMEIELTAKEVEQAQRCAGEGKRRYRILYVPFALDPSRRAIYILPNPFSVAGRALFRARGSGLKYRFQLAD